MGNYTAQLDIPHKVLDIHYSIDRGLPATRESPAEPPEIVIEGVYIDKDWKGRTVRGKEVSDKIYFQYGDRIIKACEEHAATIGDED